jgi:hypothetical protein
MRIKLVSAVLITVLAMPIMMMVGFSILDSRDRHLARTAIGAAFDRINSVGGNYDDAKTLIAACESLVLEINCRQMDYNVVFRGHRLPFTTLAIDYHRVWRVGDPRGKARPDPSRPFMTAMVHIDRKPRVLLGTYQ